MKKTLFALTFLLTTDAWANSCLRPGTRTLLDETPVQDQDGLGICYASAGSLLVQHGMGSKEPLSYHMMAISLATATNHSFENGNMFKPFSKPGDSLAMDGGTICSAVKAVKQTGICQARTFPLDLHGVSDPWNRQLKILEAYGDFIDKTAVHAGRMSDRGWKALESALAEQIRNNQKECRLKPEERFLKHLAEQIPKNLYDGVNRYQFHINRLEKELRDPKVTDRATKETHLKNARDWQRLYQGIADTVLRKEAVGRNPDRARYVLTDAALRVLRQQVPTYLRALGAPDYSKLNTSNEVNYEVELPDMEAPLAALYRHTVQAGTPIQRNMPPLFARDVFTTWSALKAHSSLGVCELKLDPVDVSVLNVPDLIAPICDGVVRPNLTVDAAATDAETIVNALKQTTRPHLIGRTNPLLNLLAPKCIEQLSPSMARLKNLQCESVSLLPLVKQDDPDITEDFASEPASRRMTKSQDWVMQRLCKRQPVAVDVCSGFLQNEGSVDGEFCKNSIGNASRKDSNHAVVIVGYEVLPNRQVRYLVQNSWGRKCTFENARIAAGKNAECEKDEIDESTGRFWISDRVLLSNSFKLNSVPRAQ